MKLLLFKNFCFKTFCHSLRLKEKLILIHLLIFFCAFSTVQGFAQNNQSRVVTGQVTSETGESLVGVTVRLRGTNTATLTDVNGKYRISVSGAQAVLTFTYVGYVRFEESVQNNSVLNIKLNADTRSLDEVVVVGYGTSKKRDVTGSVVSIKTGNLPLAATTSINSLLQDKAAGLNMSLASAQPGGRLNVNIRGQGSPLYVIDGVPLFNNSSPEPSIQSFSNSAEIGFSGGVNRDPLNTINPDDIASVDVLKDASAAAIYGSAASNGVILITTKKGKADGKVTTDFRTSTSIQTPKKYFQLLNATQFEQQQVRLAKDKFLYDNNLPPYGNATTTPVFTPMFSEADIAAAGVGTDWLKLLMRDGRVTEHNLSMSGGTPKTKVFSSFNYYNNKAIVQNSDYTRLTGRVNLEQQISDIIKFSVNMTISQTKSSNASSGDGGQAEKFNSLQAAYGFSPAVGIYDANGNYTKSTNSLVTNPAAFGIIDDKLNSSRLFLAPKLEFKVVKNFNINLEGGIDQQKSDRKFFLPAAAQDYLIPDGMAQISSSAVNNYSIEAYGNYNKKIGDHSINLVAGGGYYMSYSESAAMQGVGFFTDALSYNNIGLASNKDKTFISSNRSADNIKISQYFRANYSYKSKYILTFNARNDGASQFAANKKWGFFPGISGAWRISEESFMSKVKVVSDLKLRAGYGLVGNVGGLNALSLLSTGGGNYLIGTTYYSSVAASQLANPDLSWETIRSSNIGLDYGFFNDRITGSIDVFRRDRLNILSSAPLPVNNSVSSFNTNLGSQRSEGFEFSINTKNFQGKNFTWETDLNISNNHSIVLTRSPYASPLQIWQHLSDRQDMVFGWKTLGIINTTAEIPTYMPNARLGNIIYQDFNNDGKLDAKDVQFLGYSNPKFSFGFGNKFTYKNFNLEVNMYGRVKQWQGNNLTMFNDPSRIAVTAALNTTAAIKNVWSSDNTSGTLPGIAANPYSGANPSGNDFYSRNVSFLRIRNITLGYTFNPKKMFLRSARIYLDVQNVGIITNYKGYDPEISESNPYPQSLTTTLGINIGF